MARAFMAATIQAADSLAMKLRDAKSVWFEGMAGRTGVAHVEATPCIGPRHGARNFNSELGLLFNEVDQCFGCVQHFYTSEPPRAYYGTPLRSVIFFERPKKFVGCVSDL